MIGGRVSFVRSRWSCLGIGDGLKEMGPIVEDDVGGGGSGVLEEAISGATGSDGGAPGEDAELRDGVEGKGQQVEGGEDVGEGLLAVTEIVFEVVDAALENVEGLVLDLPSGAAAGGEFGHGLGGDRQVGHEAVEVSSRSLGIADLDGEAIDVEGIVGIAQWHAGEPAVDAG